MPVASVLRLLKNGLLPALVALLTLAGMTGVDATDLCSPSVEASASAGDGSATPEDAPAAGLAAGPPAAPEAEPEFRPAAMAAAFPGSGLPAPFYATGPPATT